MKKKSLKLNIFAAVFLALILALGRTSSLMASEPEETDSVKEEESEKLTGGGYAATGQIPGVGFSTELYDATNGLPTSDANYLLCSSDGYIWIGAYSGIIRYDGSSFERLDSSDGLTSGRGLFEDSRGRIWVGTNDNGVVVIDKGQRTHISYKEGLPSSSIRHFAEDHSGNIYVATTSGVCYIDSGMAVHIVDDERIKNQRILRLETADDGVIYGQTNNGIVFSIDSGKVKDYFTGEDLGTETLTAILPVGNNRFYLCTDAGVVYYGELGGKAELEKISAAPLENLHWICNACGRIWVSSPEGTGYIDEKHVFHLLENLPMNSGIEMMDCDYQGNMWYASSAQGVMKVVANNFTDYTYDTGIETGVVNATFLNKGRLYIGTNSGMYILDDQRRVIENDLTDYVGGARVRSFALDKKGNILVSCFNHDLGLVSYSPDGKIASYTTQNGMPGNEIRCVSVAEDGRLIVGTNSGIAIINEGKVERTIGVEDGILNTVILNVAIGDDGEILAGTDGDGIYIINEKGIKHIGRDDGLTSDVVMKIKKDEERGVYWIVTSNSIEYLHNGIVNNVYTFPYNNNYDLYTYGEDMWILSSYGIYIVKINDMIIDRVADYRLYTIDNGLVYAPTSNSYSAIDDQGNMYIPGRNGVCLVNIRNFSQKSAYVKLGVRSVFSNNEEILPDENGDYIIPAGSGRIRISPAVLDYSLTNPLVHVYLEGSDDDGITAHVSNLGVLEYTGLAHGNYTLHIQVMDNATGDVRYEEIFGFTKQPQIHELLVVRILIVAAIALVAGLIIWRILSGTVVRQQLRQIKEAKEEAEQANTAKTRFLANMSHVIRNPINTIIGMDEMIMREKAVDVPKPYYTSVMNYASDIKKASTSLLEMVNSILDMSVIESGKMHLKEKEYDLKECVHSVIPMIRIKSREKDLLFEVHIDEELPAKLIGDEGKIKQIVLNLLNNAVKFTHDGSVVLSVAAEESTEEEVLLCFSVKDTGEGIKPEDIDKLFSDNEGENTGAAYGQGMGLTISRRFADLMGGSISCESTYGEGSEIFLRLRQKISGHGKVGKFDTDEEKNSGGAYVPQFIAPDADILVVDDDPKSLTVIKSLLRDTKVFVTTAKSGEDCLEKIKYGSFNIVLIEHMMQGMSGADTVARIRENHPDLPVYALTADSTADVEHYLSQGYTGYLSKPIDSLLLEKTIMKHIPEKIMDTSVAEKKRKEDGEG